MFCTSCGAENPEGSAFCTSCGAPMGGTTAGKGRAGAHGATDETVTMPPTGASPASASSEPGAPRRGGHGSAAVAVVMSVIALVAVVALVVVVVNPLGFGGGGQGQPDVAQEQASTPTEDEDAEDEDAKGGDAEDVEDDADASSADEPAEEADDEPAEEPSGTGAAQQNNLVVVVDSDDATPAPPQTTIVHRGSDDYVLPDSATYEYSTGELSGLSDWELYLARNEIYARHGREFRNEDLRRYFSGRSWYTPLYSPDDFDARVGSFLNATEQRNAETILSLEQSRGSAYI